MPIALKSEKDSGTKIVLTVFSDGERCPILVDREGVPIFDATVWSVTKYRHKSSATMEQALRGAMLIHNFCWRQDIDLTARIESGAFFATGELDALLSEAFTPSAHLRTASRTTRDLSFGQITSHSKLLLIRKLPSNHRKQSVGAGTAKLRLMYAAEYIKWLGERRKHILINNGADNKSDLLRPRAYAARLKEFVNQIEERSPSATSKGRISLSAEQRAKLLSVFDVNSHENPWDSHFVRIRNWLIIRWLLGTGMRRGELLGLQVRDFDRRRSCLEIRRRQDNKCDQRRRQPNVKTLERLAPLDEYLTEIGEQYLKARNKIDVAMRHRFFFVAEDGKPLSESAIAKMFATARARYPDVGPVSAHVLRHQWNEDFSSYADSVKLNADEEIRERCWLMGWAPGSKMPAYYLKRRTRAKADEHVTEMQRRLMKNSKESKQEIMEIVLTSQALLEAPSETVEKRDDRATGAPRSRF